MATLNITTKIGGGARQPFLAIDGVMVNLDNQGNGQVIVTGTCGDGSDHFLVISFLGPVGATMSAIVTCGASVVCTVKESKVTALREPFGGTIKPFKL